MTSIIGNMKQLAMIAIFGFILMGVEVTPTTLSGLAVTVNVGVSKAIADDSDKSDKSDKSDDSDKSDKSSESVDSTSSNLICDCTTLANASAVADKAKDDDKAKEDDDKVTLCHVPLGNPDNEQTIRVGAAAVDSHIGHHAGDHLGACAGDEDQAKKDQEDDDKAKEDDDKAKEDDDKALADVSTAVAGAPCSCGDGGGVTGYWTDSVGGSATPPGGSAPKAVRQIQGQ